jgi:hypothetical protein
MNVYELVTETLAQCGIVDPDASDRSEKKPLFLTSYNEALKKICREKLHPWTSEAITLDASKCFDTKTLSKRLVEIQKVSKYQDYSTSASGAASPPFAWDLYDGNGKIVVPAADASGTMFIEYEYMPEPLKVTYHISGANTLKVIPIDEAISAAEATALVGKTLGVIDVSTGLSYEYTIASAAAGAAGAATITVNETIAEAVADGDEIYIGENWEPSMNEDWHMLLTYWATYKYLSTRGVNYAGLASFHKDAFYEEYGYIDGSIGEPQEITGAYSPQIGR